MPALHFLVAVAIGHLVAEHGAQAGLIHGVADYIQAARNEVGTGVVVNQAGCAVFNGIDQADEGAGADAVAVQGFVQGPPQPLQDLGKVAGGRTRDRQAAGVGAVEVSMGADISGHEVLPTGVDDFGRRIARAEFGSAAQRPDPVAINIKRLVREQLRVSAQGNQIRIDNQHVGRLHSSPSVAQGMMNPVDIEVGSAVEIAYGLSA